MLQFWMEAHARCKEVLSGTRKLYPLCRQGDLYLARVELEKLRIPVQRYRELFGDSVGVASDNPLSVIALSASLIASVSGWEAVKSALAYHPELLTDIAKRWNISLELVSVSLKSAIQKEKAPYN